MALSPLPIDPLLPSVVQAVTTRGTLVLQAAPGAGKTTRVPRALLDAGAFEGELWVLEPRRLATRLAAARVAEELGEPVGQHVGYQIRFEEVASPATRVRFVTEGVLTRRLLSDPGSAASAPWCSTSSTSATCPPTSGWPSSGASVSGAPACVCW
jgi:ATP-dependent helicase HrpB